MPIAKHVIQRPKIAYAAINIAHGLFSVSALPALALTDVETAALYAKGMIIGQLASIAGSYSFAIDAPRTLLALSSDERHIILRSLLAYQTLVLFSAICTCIIVSGRHWDEYLPTASGCVSAYSAVFVWQWFFVANPNHRVTTEHLAARFANLLILASTVLIPRESIKQDLFLLILTGLLPALSTRNAISATLTEGHVSQPTLQELVTTLRNQLKSGRRIFATACASAVYGQGTSLFTFLFLSSDILMAAQFDRMRIAAANFGAILISLWYPSFVGKSELDLKYFMHSLKKLFLYPITITSLALILFIDTLCASICTDYGVLGLPLQLVLVSLLCATLSICSNAISMLYLYPKRKDDVYTAAIIIGAATFLLSSLAMLTGILNVDVTIFARSVFLAEAAILFTLIFASKDRA